MSLEHADAVLAIYRQGIETRIATFETNVPGWSAWDGAHLPICRFVAISSGEVAGWAALLAVSRRRVYHGVAEFSIYIGERFRGRGVGSMLMDHTIAAAEDEGFWTLQAGIFPENEVSIALHQRFGFRIVGVRERIGQLDGAWKDVLLLERRSPSVGAEP